MKKLLFFVFAAIAFAACTQNDVEELSANRADVPETLTVGFEGGDDTRIQLNEAQKTVWTKDDLVSVFYRSNANQKWQYQGETGERVGVLKRLESGVATRDLDNVVVVYPYNENYYINPNSCSVQAMLPATQHYKQNSYGYDGNIMVSCEEYNQISLRNVCGWLKIQLTGNGERVQSITLRGNNGEQVAGEVYINAYNATSVLASDMGSLPEDDEIGAGGAGGGLQFDDTIFTELTLDCGEGVELGAEATAFYIAVPPQTFEQGVAVEILCDGYKPMTLATTSEVVIERNHIKPMAAVEFEAEEGEEVIPYNEIHYTATAKVEANSNYPWSFDTFGANIVSNEWDSESGKGVITFDDDVTTIGYAAFAFCSSLTSVTIPDSVTTIGDYAFYECNSLTSVTIGDSVTTIGEAAFAYCSSLTSVTIGDSVTTIGNDAFHFCTSLTSVTIPDSVTTIGDVAFYSCYSLTSVTIGDSVTTIGRYAFSGCSSLTSITIPDSVTTIGGGAFSGCSLTSVTIPDSVTTIGQEAFSGCSSLTSVTIPDSVTTIGGYAFCDCDRLTSVTIPDSVTTIGERAFYYCDSLTSVTIGDSVTTIGEWAFENCYSLTSVTIPDSVTTIGEWAFGECSSLTSVTIPDSVTTIGYAAFYGCSSLASVYCEATTPPSLDESYVFDNNASGRKIYVPAASVEAYKTAAYWSKYADYIVGYDFENGVVVELNNEIRYTATAKVEASYYYPWTFDTFGANIVSNEWDSESGEGVITFDADVTTIGEDAFNYCSSLASVTIPDSVTTIGDGAFFNCVSLTSITIPDSVTTIGRSAFSSCSSLTSITIGDSVTTIGDYAFAYCSNITSITIPDSVTTIGGGAFSGCSLTSVTIGDSVTTIGDEAFSGCSSLTSVTIPDSVTTIGGYAFHGCSSLTSVTIPDSVTTIGEVTFCNCTSLTSITIPDSVTTIGYAAFYDCNSLISITIPDSVTTIGQQAFLSCDSLTSITIPDSVTTIGGYAFAYCDSLTEFNGKFASEDSRCLIVDGTLNSFAPAGLTSYTIPDSVTTIGGGAFSGCSLTSVTIGDSVTTIGDEAFYNCDSLTEFNGKFASEDGRCLIVDGTLNSFAPAGLTSYTIPDSVTTIGERAFYDCDSLTSVTIGDSVTTIGNNAFYDCSSLTSVYCEATTPPSLGGSSVFTYNASGRKIYVPAASVEAYKTADYWSKYADYIVGYDFE